MERRDYLITQIQQLGRFLRTVIEKLLGRSAQLDLETEMSYMNESFREKCGFDILLLANPDFELLKDELISNNTYNAENLELLADFMVILANKSDNAPVTMQARLKYNAISLYEHIDVIQKAYSIDRQIKIEEIKSTLA